MEPLDKSKTYYVVYYIHDYRDPMIDAYEYIDCENRFCLMSDDRSPCIISIHEKIDEAEMSMDRHMDLVYQEDDDLAEYLQEIQSR